jgi:asparagine synthetase B (glutamine-hydrolysing)
MCGLVGAFIKSNNGFTTNEVKVFNELLYMDALRGMDSTGVACIKKDGSASVIKKSTWAPSFLVSKAYETLEKTLTAEGKILFGHNRKATVGLVNSVNAHPFTVKKEFILMHNGSLPVHKHLADTEVDSEAIAQYLHDKWNDDDTPEKKSEVLSKLNGAYALVWYDMRTEKLNIVRNSQRPMFYTEHNGSFFFCSDQNMLNCALERNYYGQAKVKSLPVSTLLTFDGTGVSEVTLPFFSKPVTYTRHGPVTNSIETEEDVSKNRSKKLIAKHTGTLLLAALDRFLEIHGKYCFVGENPDWSFKHELIGSSNDPILVEYIKNNYMLADVIITGGSYDKFSKTIKFFCRLKPIHEAALCN